MRDPAVVQGGEEVAHVQDPGDLVERVAVDRVARERRLEQRRERLLGRHRDRDRDHLRPRHHHLVDFLVREVEDLVEHLLLGRRDHARVLGAGDDVANLLLGVGELAGRRRRDPEEARDRVSRDLQQPGERLHDRLQDLERDRERLRDRLGPLQRERLRHELAERDAEVGEDQEREHVRDPVRERRVEVARQERLADGTEGDPEDGDPDLDGADELDRVVHQVERGARTAAAGLRVRLEARPPRRHERVLGRDEDRVPEHEQEDREDSEGVAHAPLSGAWVLEGSSKLARSIGNDSDVIGAAPRAPRARAAPGATASRRRRNGGMRASARRRRGRARPRSPCAGRRSRIASANASRSRWCSISSRARPTGSAIGSPCPGSAISGSSSIVRSSDSR